MVITYHGIQCFKVVFGDTTIAFNPIAKDSRHKSVKFGADIAFITTNHPDMNGSEQAALGDRAPVVINGPGEYEVRGIFARGFGVQTTYEKETYINTVYVLKFEGMQLCFLGALASQSLPQEAKEFLSDIDILFLPLGGNEGLIAPADAYRLSVSLEPKIIIPMQWGESGMLPERSASLAAFVQEEGSSLASLDRLTIKKKDLEEGATKVIVLSV